MATIDRDSDTANLPEPEEVAETLDRIGTAAVGMTDDDSMITGDFDDDSNLKWLAPLAIVVLLVVLGFWFCGGAH